MGERRIEIAVPEPVTPWWEQPVPGTALRAIELLGVIGLGLGIYAVFQAQYQTQLAQDALFDQRISSAWQTLAIEGGGSTGKGYALGQLISASQTVSGLVLGCNRPGVDFASPDREWGALSPCARPTVISGVEIVGPEITFVDGRTIAAQIVSSDFQGAMFLNVGIGNVDMLGVSFDDAVFDEGRFTGSLLTDVSFKNVAAPPKAFVGGALFSVDFTGADLGGAVFQNVEFYRVQFTNADISEVTFTDNLYWGDIDISGAALCSPTLANGERPCNTTITQDFLTHAYFESDNPPRGLEHLSPDLQLNEPCTNGRCPTRGLVQR